MIRALAILWLIASPALASLNIPAAVEAIRLVENARPGDVGAAGERGPWQTREAIWRQYSDKPFWWASRAGEPFETEQRRVATAHARWISARLVRLGLPETARSVGLVWNAGYGTVLNGRTLARHRDYADRVQNVYDDGAGLTRR